MGHPLVIGHRGAPRIHLENTIDSFIAAIELGVDMFELDAQITVDGHLVVFHDFELTRLANDERLIHETSFSEIKEVDIGDGHRIPTLDDVLDIAKNDVQVNIEIKVPDIEEKVLSLVREKEMLDEVLFSSFIHGTLSNIMKLEPSATTAILYNSPIADVVSYAKELGVSAINPLFILLEPFVVEQAHAQNLKVYPWTVNEPDMIEAFLKMDVDGIISDVPDICIEKRSSLQ